MENKQVKTIAAVVTLREADEIQGGGAPVFHARDEQEREEVAFYLGKLLSGIPHDLGNGSYVIIKH